MAQIIKSQKGLKNLLFVEVPETGNDFFITSGDSPFTSLPGEIFLGVSTTDGGGQNIGLGIDEVEKDCIPLFKFSAAKEEDTIPLVEGFRFEGRPVKEIQDTTGHPVMMAYKIVPGEPNTFHSYLEGDKFSSKIAVSFRKTARESFLTLMQAEGLDISKEWFVLEVRDRKMLLTKVIFPEVQKQIMQLRNL